MLTKEETTTDGSKSRDLCSGMNNVIFAKTPAVMQSNLGRVYMDDIAST